jgi:simple sugar transport system permease protein
MGLVGGNPVACAAERLPVGRRLVQALVLSGAIAGLASCGTVLGYKGYYEAGLGSGAGFGGLAVALLGRGSPVGLVLAALFFGTLAQGGLAINAHVPMEAMDVLQGVVIVAVALADVRVRSALARVSARATA